MNELINETSTYESEIASLSRENERMKNEIKDIRRGGFVFLHIVTLVLGLMVFWLGAILGRYLFVAFIVIWFFLFCGPLVGWYAKGSQINRRENKIKENAKRIDELEEKIRKSIQTQNENKE